MLTSSARAATSVCSTSMLDARSTTCALQTSSSSQRTHGRVIRRSYNREQKQLKALHMPKSEARCFIAHTSNSCRLVASSVPTICQLSSVTIFLS